MPDLDPTQPRREPVRPDDPGASQPKPTQPGTPPATGSYLGLSSASTIPELFQPPTSADEIGRVGDYRILKALGEGGMGAVFLAEDTRLQRQVALKFLLPILATSEHGRVRFLREARAAARIRHEHVVVVYDVDEVRGLPFIAMELLKGATLDTFLRKKGPQLLERVVRVGKQILMGLDAAHQQGLVHRDIKPANIWLEPPHGKVRLLDFGLATQPDGPGRVTSTGVIVGTPAYMSPEQARGEVVDHRSDLWSVGVVLYQMVTGRAPFAGNNQIDILLNVCSQTPAAPSTLARGLPKSFDQLIARLLSKEVANRPKSAVDAIALLDGLGAAGSAAPAASSGWLPAADLAPVAPPLQPTTFPYPPAPPAPTGYGWPPQPPAPQPTPYPAPYPYPPPYPHPQAAPAPYPYPAPQPAPQPPPQPVPVPYPAAAANATAEARVEVTVNAPVEDEAARRRRELLEDEEMDYRRERRESMKGDGLATASLTLGIVSFVAVFFCFCGGHLAAVPLALLGLGCGLFARKDRRVAGIILNVLALIPGILVLAFAATLLNMIGCAKIPR